MKKASLWHLIVAYVAVVLFMIGAGLVEARTVELKFAHFMSPNHIQHVNTFDRFAKKVEEISQGKVKVTIYPGGALGNARQLADSVAMGVADMAFIIPPYNTARFPRFAVMDMPFLFQSSEHATHIIYELFDRYFYEDMHEFKVLWMHASPPGQIMSVDKPTPTMASLSGMKIRTPTAYMSKVLTSVDANPIGMPISELAISLQRKIIDGMVAPFSAIGDFQLYDLVSHVAKANTYVTPMVVIMNKHKYESLPEEAKKVIDQASGMQMGIHAARVYDNQDLTTIKEIEKRGKITIIEMDQAEIDKFNAAVKPLEEAWVEEAEQSGLPAREMIEAVHASLEKFAKKAD
jgi:TRAP-type transport system periplasmic protein